MIENIIHTHRQCCGKNPSSLKDRIIRNGKKLTHFLSIYQHSITAGLVTGGLNDYFQLLSNEAPAVHGAR